MKISVLIPAYNEQSSIREILERIRTLDLDLEIIVIDDGSTDGTRQIVQQDPHVKLLVHERNRGKGAAIRTGLKEAHGEIILIQDADLEYDPKDYGALIEPFQNPQCQVVYGSRLLGQQMGLSTRWSSFWFYWGGRLLSALTSVLYGCKITDEATCYKVFRKNVLDDIVIESSGFEFCPEVTAKVLRHGYRIIEVPISYHPRTRDEGKKIKWTDGIVAMWTLLKFRFF